MNSWLVKAVLGFIVVNTWSSVFSSTFIILTSMPGAESNAEQKEWIQSVRDTMTQNERKKPVTVERLFRHLATLTRKAEEGEESRLQGSRQAELEINQKLNDHNDSLHNVQRLLSEFNLAQRELRSIVSVLSDTATVHNATMERWASLETERDLERKYNNRTLTAHSGALTALSEVIRTPLFSITEIMALVLGTVWLTAWAVFRGRDMKHQRQAAGVQAHAAVW